MSSLNSADEEAIALMIFSAEPSEARLLSRHLNRLFITSRALGARTFSGGMASRENNITGRPWEATARLRSGMKNRWLSAAGERPRLGSENVIPLFIARPSSLRRSGREERAAIE